MHGLKRIVIALVRSLVGHGTWLMSSSRWAKVWDMGVRDDVIRISDDMEGHGLKMCSVVIYR